MKPKVSRQGRRLSKRKAQSAKPKRAARAKRVEMAEQKNSDSIKLFGLVIPSAYVITALVVLGGLAIQGWISNEQFARKPWVEEGFGQARRYTDEKSAQTLKEAINHSDSNRQAMVIEMTRFGAQQQAMAVKVDMILQGMNAEHQRARK
jgi:hypothetical protein